MEGVSKNQEIAEYQETYRRRAKEIMRRMEGFDLLYMRLEYPQYVTEERHCFDLDVIENRQRTICAMLLKANQIKMALRAVIVSRLRLVGAIGEIVPPTIGNIYVLRKDIEMWARGKKVYGYPLENWLFESSEDVRNGMK